ncbi:hypothetical protein AB7C87_01405 [Natrarchaeobius sp. A-rgal3]|uniref:hypothetical protein n=1 Tax=Natrarchaeobius versutus TaxID=1679078 RepID=UPI00350FB842
MAEPSPADDYPQRDYEVPEVDVLTFHEVAKKRGDQDDGDDRSDEVGRGHLEAENREDGHDENGDDDAARVESVPYLSNC